MTVNINYIGHSAFFIKSQNNEGILIDPFVSGNPNAVFDIQKNQINQIFLTHGHSDHLGDAIPIAISTQSSIYAVFELAHYCSLKGAYASGLNIGGKLDFSWGFAKFLPAFHSSSVSDGFYAGMPASILFNIDGIKIYHAGDNCLNSEFKMIGDIYKPDIALLPVGSCYTMDVDDAVIAAKWLGVKQVIPMHYNTFDAISVDENEIKTKFEKENIYVAILKPGEYINFDG